MANQCTTESLDGLLLVRVAGEVDLSWSQSIRKAVLDALSRAPAVGVDLSRAKRSAA